MNQDAKSKSNKTVFRLNVAPKMVYHSTEKIISRIGRRYKEGVFAGKSLEDYVAHEMAHCMLYQDCTSDSMFNAKYQQIESLYDKLQGISGYADRKKSGNEALAEAFVRVRNKERVSPIAKVLVNTYFGKWKK